MNYQQIKDEAKNNRGAEMTMADFRYCFGCGPRTMNRLIDDGVFEIAGTRPNNGRPCNVYRVR